MDATILLAFMFVLIAFIVVLVILGVVLIVFLRVLLSALSQISEYSSHEETHEPALEQEAETILAESASDEYEATEVAAAQDEEMPEFGQDFLSEESEEYESAFISENSERVRYDRSCAAKLCQLKQDRKEWYSELKNELLSYEKVKSRLSWRYETFRIGKTNIARFMVRGKTLCLLLAVNPVNYVDTKYYVEDISNNITTADTPTLYRIKSVKRVNYAKELIADIMRELHAFVNPRYIAKDYFMPYEGDMTLMQRGLVKRVVNSAPRKYRIEEISEEEHFKPETLKTAESKTANYTG